MHLIKRVAGCAAAAALIAFSLCSALAQTGPDTTRDLNPQGPPILRERFENTGGDIHRSEFNDIYHAGSVDKNIVIADLGPPSGGRSLHWLRKESGGYYARPQRLLTSRTGRFSVSFQTNFDTTNPYSWSFSLLDSTYRIPIMTLFIGLGYQGNQQYIFPGWLQYVKPDGSYRRLCRIKTGWHTMKMIVDLNNHLATIYYDDLKSPVAADLALQDQNAPPDIPFHPAFNGFTSANEGGFYVGDVEIDNLLATRRRSDEGRNAAVYRLAAGSWELRVSKATGALVGGEALGRQLLAATDDIYRFESANSSAYAREQDDQVHNASEDGSRLLLSCSNRSLPGITIRKTYGPGSNGEFAKQVEFESAEPEGFITYSLNMTLDPRFMAGAEADGFPYRSGLEPGELSELENMPCAVRKDFSAGVGSYRCRVNGKYVLPGGETHGSATGWDIQAFSDYVRPGATISVETRCYAFRGDGLEFQRHITSQRDYQDLFPEPRAAWVSGLICDAMFFRSGIGGYLSQAAPLPVSAAIWFLNPPWGNWWSYSDPPKSRDPDVLTLADRFRKGSPNTRVSAYANELFDKNSDVFREHPDFGVVGKDGQIEDSGTPSDAGGAPTYFLQILNSAARRYYIDMYIERVKNWKLDYLYLDGPGSLHEEQDWKLKRSVQSYDWIEFYREIKSRLTELSPARAFWSNGILPFSDISYIEWRDARWQEIVDEAKWRYPAYSLLLQKAGETPGYTAVPTYGDAGAQPGISTYTIAYGWGGHGANEAFLPWQAAALEYRGLQLEPQAVEPQWWRTGDKVEAYGFRKGQNRIVNVVGHDARDSARISVDTAQLNFDRGGVYLLRVLTMEPPSGAKAARAFTAREMRLVHPEEQRLSLDVPLHKGLLTSLVFSRAIAYAESDGARPAETGLTDTYGLRLQVLTAANGRIHYKLTCHYPGAVIFFPFTSRITAPPEIQQSSATGEGGVAGVRARIEKAGEYEITAETSS